MTSIVLRATENLNKNEPSNLCYLTGMTTKPFGRDQIAADWTEANKTECRCRQNVLKHAIQGEHMTPEPFVSVEKAAEFLDIRRQYLLSLARKGVAGAYPLNGQSKRKVWRFRLSELVEAIAKTPIPKNGKLCDPASGSPR
jgi:hypothetical protein